MKILNYSFIVVFLSFSLSVASMADDMSTDQNAYHPSAERMIVDGLVYRPLSLAGTIIGTGIFIVTLPFSLIGGNVDQAGQALVVEPAQNTFQRCLGCLPEHDYNSSFHND